MKPLRFAVVVVLLVGAGVFLRARDRGETLPSRTALAEFPKEAGAWHSEDVPLGPEVKEVLGDGDFLLRIYRSPGQPFVDFFLAYFPTQRTGSTIHSPQNCLPGAGWSPVDFARISLPFASGGKVTVNRYVISKGLDRQLVLYWYQSNGRVVASEYWAKIFLVTDSIRRNRSDGALLRVVTPIARGESAESAEQRALGFAREIFPQLDRFVPR
ncbi:MAG: EpsI family protein [Acidobacteria bacterium]|nr:EpsI family protein [Acidobacteriota bacterium]MBI3661940.1 EpsI family protein [Acidobacteriota bacterium]